MTRLLPIALLALAGCVAQPVSKPAAPAGAGEQIGSAQTDASNADAAAKAAEKERLEKLRANVDAAAAAAIRQAILDRAAEGAAVVVISQDLDELLEIADNFAALNEGRLTPPRPVAGLTIDEIGLMMGGAHGMEVAHHAH